MPNGDKELSIIDGPKVGPIFVNMEGLNIPGFKPLPQVVSKFLHEDEKVEAGVM